MRAKSIDVLEHQAAWDRLFAAAGDVDPPARDPDQVDAIRPLQFRMLRHTAVTRLLEAGCTAALTASITGHGLTQVEAIIDLYGIRTRKMAKTAFKKRLAQEAELDADNEK